MRHLSLALSNPLSFFFAQTWSQVIGLLSFDFDLLMISANYQISLILPFVTKPLVIIFFLRQLFLQCYNLLLLVFGSASFFLLSESFKFSVADQSTQISSWTTVSSVDHIPSEVRVLKIKRTIFFLEVNLVSAFSNFFISRFFIR